VTRGLWARILVAQIGVALALSVVLPFLIGRVIQDIGDHQTRQFLSGEADRWIGAGGGSAGAGSAVTIYDIDGAGRQLRAGSPLPDVASAPLPPVPDRAFAHGPFSDFYVRATGPGRWTLVGEDRRHPAVLVDDVIAAFLQRFAIIVPLAVLASAAASLVAVNRALRPVRRAADEARAINAVHPGAARLHQAGVPDEILPLVHAANELLDRAAADFAREKIFAATVVHELRTALATISLRAEALEAGSAARQSVMDAVERANRVVSQMLELHGRSAELQTGSMARIGAAVAGVVEPLQELARASGRALHYRPGKDGALPALVSRSLVELTLQNIVENALRHSLPGTDIEVECDPDSLTVSVSDQGPGLKLRAASDGRIVYSRADGVATGSSGLGLAIVTRLMETAGGSIEFSASAAGGTRIDLCYPEAGPGSARGGRHID